jgi:hypothetical protein
LYKVKKINSNFIINFILKLILELLRKYNKVIAAIWLVHQLKTLMIWWEIISSLLEIIINMKINRTLTVMRDYIIMRDSVNFKNKKFSYIFSSNKDKMKIIILLMKLNKM